MKQDLDELGELSWDKTQANVIPVSGGSSDSETETEDENEKTANEKLTGMVLWLHNQAGKNKKNPPPKDSIDECIDDGIFDDDKDASDFFTTWTNWKT